MEPDELDELDELEEADELVELDDPLVPLVDPLVDFEAPALEAPAFVVFFLAVVVVVSVPEPLAPPCADDPLDPDCVDDVLPAPALPVAPWAPPTRPIRASTSHRTVVLLALSIEPVSAT
jgi:hypothetical protein